jgi:cytoskeleton protein RodZ
MLSFFDELRAERQAKGISLADIAEATKINIQFLEDLEQGNTSRLPQAYVRAFLREYAIEVGLDPQQTLERYTAAMTAGPPPDAGVVQGESLKKPIAAPTPEPDPKGGRSRGGTASSLPLSPRVAGGAIAALLLVAAIVTIWNLTRSRTPEDVEEIPFDRVVQEHQQRAEIDTLSPAGLPARTPPSRQAFADSLVLRAATTDTVWMQIIIDDMPPREYMFNPNMRLTWKAERRFSVTVGSAGAIEFTLNDKKLGTLGRPGAVIRNVELSRSTLVNR